jgi:glucose-6-phosphate 1-dehydrogenase
MNIFLILIFSLMIGLNSIILGTSSAQLSALESHQIDEVDKKLENQPAPCIIGSRGDLIARKLLSHNDKTFRKQMGEAIGQFDRIHAKDVDFWNQFENKIFYNQADFEQDQGMKTSKDSCMLHENGHQWQLLEN